MIVFSYLTGSELFHKIALLNKTTRQMLPESGILQQVKVLTMKSVPSYLGNLNFGLSLVDVIELVATQKTITVVNAMANQINFKNGFSKKYTEIDLTLDGLT